MALGFGPVSDEPLCALPRLSLTMIETCFLVAQALDPVAFLTTNRLKRLVFAVEIGVLPLTGATTPHFGTET